MYLLLKLTEIYLFIKPITFAVIKLCITVVLSCLFFTFWVQAQQTDAPTINLSEDSDVSIWYFHGQRDAGGDSGDFFRLETSINGGAYTLLVTFGDEQVNAQWQQASVSLNAGQSVRFRVRVADGTAGGDLIEAGVDDIMVCPQ